MDGFAAAERVGRREQPAMRVATSRAIAVPSKSIAALTTTSHAIQRLTLPSSNASGTPTATVQCATAERV